MLKTYCGCAVELLDNGRDAVIHYCAVHGAAPELLAALKTIEADDTYVEEGRGVVTKLKEIARAAIATVEEDRT